jgi:hypothetical protein
MKLFFLCIVGTASLLGTATGFVQPAPLSKIHYSLSYSNPSSGSFGFLGSVIFQPVDPPRDPQQKIGKKVSVRLIHYPSYKINNFSLNLVERKWEKDRYIIDFSASLVLDRTFESHCQFDAPLGYFMADTDHNESVQSETIFLPKF